jgi:general secretion pathway protein C
MKHPFTWRLAAALAALLLWALVAISALYWIWYTGSVSTVATPVARVTSTAGQTIDAQAVAQALGSSNTKAAPTGSVPSNDRFVLRGVVTYGLGTGAALIGVDGKPPKTVRLGAAIADSDGWILRSITPGGAVLASGEQEIKLNVPRPEPGTDATPGIQSGGMFSPRMPVPIPRSLNPNLSASAPSESL